MKSLAQLKVDAKRSGWGHMINTPSDEAAMLAGYGYDKECGQIAVDFFEQHLVHTMGQYAGKPFKLLDWQKNDIILPLFGWVNSDGKRRFTKGDVFVAKKQGKSTIAAGLANYFLLLSGQRSEVYGVAHTREQAGIIYREAAAMARSSPALSKRLKPIDSAKRVVYKQTASFYQALAGESGSRSVEGINPVLLLFDEIHVQRSRELYDALTYASTARYNSLMLSVSTVGVADPTTIWWEQYTYAKGVLDGSITDPSRFAYLAQADEECKDSKELRADPAQWRKAMPSLGITVTEDKVAEAVREAENSPAKLNNLLRYLFNVPTAQVTRCIPWEKWKAGALPEEPQLDGQKCYAGLDIASHEDLTSLVLYFPDTPEPGVGYLKAWFWCPDERVREKERRQMAFYREWVNDGWLTETQGNQLDHYAVEATIRECCEKYNVVEIGFDPANADAVVNPLMNEGYPLVKVLQTFGGMSTGCTSMIGDIVDGRLHHNDNRVLSWCMSNVSSAERGDEIRFVKDAHVNKIDGAVAAAMAIGRDRADVSDPVPMIFF